MSLFRNLADRRIREGRDAGLFDDLDGAGEPITDLHQQRPEGWWGQRFVNVERARIRVEDFDERIDGVRSTFWRAEDQASLRRTIAEVNALIERRNRAAATVDRSGRHTRAGARPDEGPIGPRSLLDADTEIERCRRAQAEVNRYRR